MFPPGPRPRHRLHRAARLVTVGCALVGAAAAQEPLRASISSWSGGREAAVSVTFDDAHESQITTLEPMLDKHGLRATFYIVSKWVQGKQPPKKATWAAWKALLAKGHEIGSHTHTHPYLAQLFYDDAEKELAEAQKIIQKELGPETALTVAFPYANRSPDVEKMAAKYYLCARGGGPNPAPPDPANLFNLPSYVWTSKTTAADMDRSTDQALAQRGWTIEMGHGTDGEGWEPPASSEYKAHFDRLATLKDRVWVAPVLDVFRYILSRKACAVETSPGMRGAWRLDLLVKGTLPAKPVPLTVAVDLPADWTGVRASQGTTILPVTVKQGNPSQALFELTPAKEGVNVELRPLR